MEVRYGHQHLAVVFNKDLFKRANQLGEKWICDVWDDKAVGAAISAFECSGAAVGKELMLRNDALYALCRLGPDAGRFVDDARHRCARNACKLRDIAHIHRAISWLERRSSIY